MGVSLNTGRGARLPVAKFALDASGNVAGMVGPDQRQIRYDRAAALGRAKRVMWRGNLLTDWNYSLLGSNTITSANDTADGLYAGGEIVTMTQVTTGSGNKNALHSARILPPMLGANVPWFVTGEMKVPTSRFATVTLNDGASTSLIYAQVGPANLVTLAAPDGTTVTSTPTGFDQNTWHRITAVALPTGATTGSLRLYLHYKDTTEKRAYIGAVPYSNSVLPIRVSVTQDWTAANALLLTKFVAAEVHGVMVGTSLEAGYVGWAPSPESARTFALTPYNAMRNPAALLAQQLNGDDEYMLNHAMGGHRIDQMSADWSDWVLALAPRLVVLGSPTNSIAASLSDGNPTAYMATARAQYLAMCTEALSSGAAVLAIGAEPRHDTTIVSLGLATFAERALSWNAWAKATLAPLGVAVCDTWTDLVDPSAANQLVAWANAGDNVHFSWRAQRLRARRQMEAFAK